eukprot:CAMPEP_0182464358 /NCGR_PEP_ID=MMETSP1319-20130603/8551_1 /TAXON_ID=172717 /ORGANISM="Bolidomonas pacifica, Strain RCC208" /LENGTH=403 /DNA_ID=CAMNT_0024663999 /DNA_START=72 /DNA_END=1279 /DNA_ORIENTATION=+
MSEMDHTAWLASQMSLAPLTLWVDSPEEQGSGFSKYVTYALCQPNSSVRHRYSDFEKLQATLRLRYSTHGILVPSLPAKTVVVKGAGFHYRRMRGLQMFCEAVASSPYLRSDPAWAAFLEDGSPPDVEKDQNPPCPLRWRQAVDEKGETPPNAGEIIQKFKEEAAKADAEIQNLISKAKSMIASYASLSSSMTDFASATTQFAESETNSIDVLNSLSPSELSSPSATRNSVPNVMARLSTLFSSQISSLANSPEALELLLVESLSYESSQMQDCLSLLKHVDALASSNDKNSRSLAALKAKSTAKMTQEKIDKHNAAVAAAELALEQGREHTDRYIRALVTLTLPSVSSARRDRISRLSLHLGAVARGLASVQGEAAGRFFDAMEVDGADANAGGSTVLEALG